jgi:hypothetical protein
VTKACAGESHSDSECPIESVLAPNSARPQNKQVGPNRPHSSLDTDVPSRLDTLAAAACELQRASDVHEAGAAQATATEQKPALLTAPSSASMSKKRASQAEKAAVRPKRPRISITLGHISEPPAAAPAHTLASDGATAGLQRGVSNAVCSNAACMHPQPGNKPAEQPRKRAAASGQGSHDMCKRLLIAGAPHATDSSKPKRSSCAMPAIEAAPAPGIQRLSCTTEEVPKSVKADRDMINTMNVSRRTSSRYVMGASLDFLDMMSGVVCVVSAACSHGGL